MLVGLELHPRPANGFMSKLPARTAAMNFTTVVAATERNFAISALSNGVGRFRLRAKE